MKKLLKVSVILKCTRSNMKKMHFYTYLFVCVHLFLGGKKKFISEKNAGQAFPGDCHSRKRTKMYKKSESRII